MYYFMCIPLRSDKSSNHDDKNGATPNVQGNITYLNTWHFENRFDFTPQIQTPPPET